MNKKIRTPQTERVFKAILQLKTIDECCDFFEDICTVNEVMSIAQRFEVAEMLRDNKTYMQIPEKTGESTATISRVNRSLNYGSDGYDLVMNRMKEEEQEDK